MSMNPKTLPVSVVRKIREMLDYHKARGIKPGPGGTRMWITGTLTIDVESGKILDIGLINEYTDDGKPRYGCVRQTKYFGSRKVVYRYGESPSFEEIQKMQRETSGKNKDDESESPTGALPFSMEDRN